MDPKKRVSSLKQYPVLAAFTLFFAALFVLDLVTPDRAYSELENTTLTQRCIPIIGRVRPFPISVIESEDVLEAKIHSGFAILSSSANVVFLTPISDRKSVV